ncbi:YifB family Mg chelatase-like AAA ATPase [Zavarzinia sp. CC-PAN008]|uniref:YifB family Mg chelatase-like AAA ATPase n=1 Tax=Zavarzinia sp. CC-PAN008 TaxID=3243332 RepID=UPI003F7449A2
MTARIRTVAIQGVDCVPVEVQVQMASGVPAFTLVGLADKAVAESRERVRAALGAIGLGLPPKRITVNLAPADLPKEGSHFDLAIAVGLLATMGAVPQAEVESFVVMGELSLDGRISAVNGVLNAALSAAGEEGGGIICPAANGPEAAWATGIPIVAAPSLLALINHLKGTGILPTPQPQLADDAAPLPDLRDIKGQEAPKRALEITAAGGHNLLMIGPPGSGKSMLAARLPGLLPPLEPAEALELSMVQSVAGEMTGGRLSRARPFRQPHHSASIAALTGGGLRARPGEASLAHLGVLFLDELPEFQRAALDSLRQPLETGRILVARANHHVSYPARFQLVAAMNPCRCGHLAEPAQACGRAPKCAVDYQARISGPMLDRIDLHVDVPAVSAADLARPPPAEGTAEVAARVAAARALQAERLKAEGAPPQVRTNADLDGNLLARVASPGAEGQALLTSAVERLRLTARGYHRVLRVARTLADLDGRTAVGRLHIAEALSYRRLANA